MKISKLQAIISIMVISFFLIMSSIIALVPVVGGYPPQGYTEHLKAYSAMYSGIIGIIIGFYFGKAISADAPSPSKGISD